MTLQTMKKFLVLLFVCFNGVVLAQDASTNDDSKAEAKQSAVGIENRNQVEGTVVDESGTPQAGVRIQTQHDLNPISTMSDHEGHFSITISEGLEGIPALLAESADGKSVGMTGSVAPNATDRFAPDVTDRRIVLKPAVTIQVNVTTMNGTPVAHAAVEALGYPVSFVGSKTDDSGHATIRVHPDADISDIIAFSDEHGFDYVPNDESQIGRQRGLPSDPVSLKLHKPYRAKVRVLDSNEKPLPNTYVDPWTVKLPGKVEDVNFSFSSIVGKKTNAEGSCEFPWFPEDASVSVTPYLSGYFTPEQKRCSAKDPDGVVVFHMMKEASVSGTVHYPDGKPAAGITIMGEGRGATNNYFRRSTITDTAGKYKLGIYPDQSTIVTIGHNDWAAKSHTDISLKEGEHRANVDFQLIKGTRIHGKVTSGENNDPLKDENVTLIENGAKLSDEIRRRFGHQTGELVRWAEVDSNGNYSFCVGPGNYTLLFPNQNQQTNRTEINVTDQKELTYDSHSSGSGRMQLVGRIVDAAGEPVSGALLHAEGLGTTGISPVTLRADDKGQFKIDRRADTEEYCFYVRDPERNLAGLTILPTKQNDVTLKAEPGVAIVGRVLDASHSPVENHLVLVITGFEQQQCARINARAKTDKNGEFRIPGLAVGSKCSISTLAGNTQLPLIRIKLETPGEMKVEDIVLPAADDKQQSTPPK